MPFAEADDPYYQAGAHPEIVERVWDKMGASLPAESRCLLYGVPVLTQPEAGIVLAVAIGTGYALRLPEEEITFAHADGYQTIWNVSPSPLDATQIFGEDWVFGRFEDRESRWCRMLYERFTSPPSADHPTLTAGTLPPARHRRGTLVLTVSESPQFATREIAVDPGGDDVERCIRSLSWKQMTFVTLDRDGNSMTASGSVDPGDGWSMSYLEDGIERTTSQSPDSIDVIVSIMRSYALRDEAWRTIVAWES